MRTLYPVIEERRARYAQHPFIRYLMDERVPASQRLAYAPFACHFVMTFAELNRTVLWRDDEADPYQQAVNRHAAEDATHWSWFLRDLATLGHDPPCTLTSALRFLWSEEGRHTREMGHYAMAVARGACPRLRVAIIETLESMGNVWLEATMVAARQHPAHDELVYFGQHHMDRETGHAMGSHQADLEALVLDAGQRAQAEVLVHGLYDRMERFNEEILARARAASAKASANGGLVDI